MRNEGRKDEIVPASKDGKLRNPGLTPRMLNHAAWVTHDVARTAEFYTRIMGMELASTVIGDRVPSTGDDFPYFHIFFRMGDGSTLAFFETPDLPAPAKATHPAYDIFNHIALQADSTDEVLRWHAWLEKNNVDVIGPVDHDGLVYSIYFHDPNGIRLEITTPLDPEWNRHTARANMDLALWVEVKERARLEGSNVSEALADLARRLQGEKQNHR